MFKMPKNNRLDEIADMIPEWISNLKDDGSGYNARIGRMVVKSQMASIAMELGIKLMIPGEINYNLLMKIVEENNIPQFAVVISTIGRYRFSFDDSPVIDITRRLGDFCIGGRIVIVSDNKITVMEAKRMKASGLESCYHVNSKEAYAF